jgi:simple sugar transport system ATP-binding protein
MTPALELAGITKSFDGFAALASADFTLLPGEVHALLGENGAGKSSLMNVAAGLYAPDEGRIRVNGSEVSIRSPSDAKALSIGMVHQQYKLVLPFSASENILLANRRTGLTKGLKEIETELRRHSEVLGFDIDMGRPVGALSIAEQQRIEILKVLIGGAHILILDEPTAVLTDRESERLLRTVRGLAAAGTAVVLVTHKLKEVLTHADRVTVMRGGRTVATADPRRVSSAELTKLVVGTTVADRREPAKDVGESILTVAGLRGARADGLESLSGADLIVRRGEIYGVAGVGGNGQTELAEVLMGILPPSGGRIELRGAGEITRFSPAERRAHGLAAIPADRQAFGLAGDLSVAENYAAGGVLAGRFGSWLKVDIAAMRDATREEMRTFEVQGVRSLRQKAALLSGGNAQKLVIAREFSGTPRLVLAHSPSRGLDMRAAAAVHQRLRAARDAGTGVLLISEDLDEIMVLADRIGVMCRGRIVAEFAMPADRHEVGRAMVDHA